MTFSNGEQALSDWMNDNEFVTWTTSDEPWEIEHKFIETVSLPLNLDQNRHHEFYSTLSDLRKRAKEHARNLDALKR